MELDVLLKNGIIYTMEQEGKTVEALGIKEGKIVFDLFANQALREQIQELDSFQAKGVLKESEKGD